jgi:hypothetical protein
MPVPKDDPIRFGAFSPLAENLARSLAVPLYEIARHVIDKLIIFHPPLNATAALPILPCGVETRLIGGICDYRGCSWVHFLKITRASKGSPD